VSDDVVGRIEAAWDELADLVAPMDDVALAAPGPDGWAVKDHLVHVGAWEHWLLALFEHRDRMAAMGLGSLKTKAIDDVNDAVWKLHRGDTPQQAIAYFRKAHQELMAVMRRQAPGDFERPYSPVFANAEGAGAQQPVLVAVAGNTYDHYAEHVGWIKERLAAE
jgi:hypothetical protein